MKEKPRPYRIPLEQAAKFAKPSCRKCNGKGTIGFERVTNRWVACSCLKLTEEQCAEIKKESRNDSMPAVRRPKV